MTVTVESAASAALGCSLPGCPAAPLVQWQRRPTEAELAALVEVEQSKRDAVLAAADAEEPGPVFGPLPTAADTTIAVYACGPHAISMDLAPDPRLRMHGAEPDESAQLRLHPRAPAARGRTDLPAAASPRPLDL